MRQKVLTSIIVDDEWLVRAELKAMLADFPQVQVLGEAANADQAIQLIEQYRPNVLFLDIQMPGASGFDLIEQIRTPIEIVFITAYDQYAIKAFEVNALDYLLKPIQKERLQKTIERLLEGGHIPHFSHSRFAYDDMVYVVISGAVKFLQIRLIQCIIAQGNYTLIYYDGKKPELVSKTLQDWQAILPEEHFIRIHRSAIVNVYYVEEVKRCKNYSQLVYVRNLEKPIIMSRRYASKLKKILAW